jgi:hypothetical protein
MAKAGSVAFSLAMPLNWMLCSTPMVTQKSANKASGRKRLSY